MTERPIIGTTIPARSQYLKALEILITVLDIVGYELEPITPVEIAIRAVAREAKQQLSESVLLNWRPTDG